MVFTNPVYGVSYEIWDRTTKRGKLSVRGEENVPALLLIHSSNDGLNDDVRCKRRVEECDEFPGEWAGSEKVFCLAEHLGLDHSRAYKSCADVRGVIMFVKLVSEGFVQGYSSSFGGTIVRSKSAGHVSNYGGHGNDVALFFFHYCGQKGTEDIEMSDNVHVQGPTKNLGIIRVYLKVRHTGLRPH